MKINEEKCLQDIILKLNSYIEDNQEVASLFDSSKDIIKTSLQDLSFKEDIEFFDEVSFILSVITSIISHPHMLNKGEEVVIRTELAPQISPEMFQKTIRDSRLWTEDSFEMVPENVYYYQQIDELRIYENIFIVNLIKKIDHELRKYSDFYVSMIECFNNQENLSLKMDNSDIALKKMNYLNRKIKHIKDTYFFRAINRGGTKLGRITPTNILVKDRLYNYCYKFYKRLITYDDKKKMQEDIRLYYLVKLLNVFKAEGFSFNNREAKFMNLNESLLIPELKFENSDFFVNLGMDTNNIGLYLEVINKHIKDRSAARTLNLLVFTENTLLPEINILNREKYDSVDAISIYHLYDISLNARSHFKDIKTEEDLIKEFLLSKIQIVNASTDIYNTYCPVCRNRSLNILENGEIECESCKSHYIFLRNKENMNEKLWFKRLRR